jgi:sugar phosphate isomerase/epimerase
MKLSTSLNVLFDPKQVSACQAVQRLARAGFEVLDFNFTDWCYNDSPFVADNWRAWVEEIGRCAADCGVVFTQCHGPIFHKFDDSERQRHLTALSHRSLEAAGMLGISWVVFEPETDHGAWDAAHLEDLKSRNVEWFSALLPTAEASNVGIALENCTDVHANGRGISRWYGSVPAELIALIDAFENPRVGACWDTGHAQIQRVDQGAALRALGKRLKALHIQDNDGKADQHLLPYYGRVKWPEIVQALRDIEFSGDFTYEVHNSIRVLPDELRDEALQFAVSIGKQVLNQK